MSKIIEFNAREYKLDLSCANNVGDRVYITTDLGMREVWEIGDWNWSWSQIFCEKKLEKNTDYILRFAVSGGYCNTWDCVSSVNIFHTDGFETTEEASENAMKFPLENDRFAPVISKHDRLGVLRVFEIPFNTGEFEDWRITFSAMHAVTRFFAAEPAEAYEKLENETIAQLRSESEAKENSRDGFGHGRVNLSGAVINKKGMEQIERFIAMGYDYIDLSGTVFDTD